MFTPHYTLYTIHRPPPCLHLNQHQFQCFTLHINSLHSVQQEVNFLWLILNFFDTHRYETANIFFKSQAGDTIAITTGSVKYQRRKNFPPFLDADASLLLLKSKHCPSLKASLLVFILKAHLFSL